MPCLNHHATLYSVKVNQVIVADYVIPSLDRIKLVIRTKGIWSLPLQQAPRIMWEETKLDEARILG